MTAPARTLLKASTFARGSLRRFPLGLLILCSSVMEPAKGDPLTGRPLYAVRRSRPAVVAVPPRPDKRAVPGYRELPALPSRPPSDLSGGQISAALLLLFVLVDA